MVYGLCSPSWQPFVHRSRLNVAAFVRRTTDKMQSAFWYLARGVFSLVVFVYFVGVLEGGCNNSRLCAGL
jgi:hypothetical protein